MRLVVVSNRLPVTVEEKSDGSCIFHDSAGGLVTGLRAYLQSMNRASVNCEEYVWVGWPGGTISNKNKPLVRKKSLKEHASYPVFLSDQEMDQYYYGFCNESVWPLFHYFLGTAQFQEETWEAYKKVNQRFCDAVLDIVKDDDIVWIQDFQLMLLPKLLREKKPHLAIGYFHHIPFPSFEIFRMFPSKWRREILEGLVASNLVGFHTHSFTSYFLRCVLRVLGHDNRMGEVIMEDHRFKAAPFPIGIEFNSFERTAKSKAVEKKVTQIKKSFSGMKTVLSVDRLDYTKGLAHRLEGFYLFLQQNPEWHGKVVLNMIVVPSREAVGHYKQMKKNIDELVGRINGQFGRVDWSPVRYQYNFLKFPDLVAMYRMSDVALITPLRDGMNLVAKEYLACSVDNEGVLILSERAGAAKELDRSILINPSHTQEISDALLEALELPLDEQQERLDVMRNHVKKYDVIRWADDFISSLVDMHRVKKQSEIRRFNAAKNRRKCFLDFKKAKKKLFLLDYDGTLRPFVKDPTKASPDKKTFNMVKRLSKLPNTDFVLISGRDEKTLKKWFGELSIGIIAEHGGTVKHKDSKAFRRNNTAQEWKVNILEKLSHYCERLPGSFIEEKRCSVAWHYRKSEPELGNRLTRELIDDLVNYLANQDFQVLRGNKVVEVRLAGVNKGTAARALMAGQEYDFIFSAGDDWTDEDTFEVLPDNAYSVKVGLMPSIAQYNIEGIPELLSVLDEFSRLK